MVNLMRTIKHFLGSRCGDTPCKLTLCGIRLIGVSMELLLMVGLLNPC